MTDILIDMTTKRRYKVNRCHYCNSDKYPDGKIIDPSDKYARGHVRTYAPKHNINSVLNSNLI